ncbi:unnamed protein product [Rhizophagus irregularis]|uniref:NAD(P)-binding protein n=1 Tax=Rhizophagus irregularis TaxID=588596 RepID=A0A2N1NWZ7_9GLOM|nr:NAD(P)-binding protein [Rhizophagus irregularis]CAB4390397.1 unnamed protein product [Rhizophagus irregularis]CAB5370549.1 unnamed protein product [Rhizophagus irregularis]
MNSVELKVLVFGATGGTGHLILKHLMTVSTPQAVYKVTAVARNPSTLNDHPDIQNPNLTVAKGNLSDEEQVKSLVSLHDIVIFAAGLGILDGQKPNEFYSRSAKWIYEAINETQKSNPNRLKIKFVCITALGLCNDPERIYLLYKWTIKRWFQPCYDDMAIMENIFLNNNDDINYVFVRPAYLNNNIPDKELRVDMDGKFPLDEVNGLGWQLNRNVLAKFIVNDCVVSDKYDKKVLGVTY